MPYKFASLFLLFLLGTKRVQTQPLKEKYLNFDLHNTSKRSNILYLNPDIFLKKACEDYKCLCCDN